MLHDENSIAAGGHDQVVKMLKDWLKRAEEDKNIDFGVILLCRGPLEYRTAFAGAAGLEFATIVGLEHAKEGIFKILKQRQRGEHD